MKTKEDLKEYLEEEAEYTFEEVEEMNDFELLDAYLEWNGIIGYTTDILEAVGCLLGKDLTKKFMK